MGLWFITPASSTWVKQYSSCKVKVLLIKKEQLHLGDVNWGMWPWGYVTMRLCYGCATPRPWEREHIAGDLASSFLSLTLFVFFSVTRSVSLHIPPVNTSASHWLAWLCCCALCSTLSSLQVREICWWCEVQGHLTSVDPCQKIFKYMQLNSISCMTNKAMRCIFLLIYLHLYSAAESFFVVLS